MGSMVLVPVDSMVLVPVGLMVPVPVPAFALLSVEGVGVYKSVYRRANLGSWC